MSKKIKKAYTDNPTAGDDTTTEGYTPFDDGSADELARSDTQLAEVMRVRLGLDDPPAQPGDTTAPVVSSFSATIDDDTLVADLSWLVDDNVAVTAWIVKEDDTSLPASGDSAWDTISAPATFTLSNYNEHTLTARARDAAGNVATPVTIIVQGTQTGGSDPVVDSFTTTDPIAGSDEFGFTLDASNATHYKFIYNSNVPPLVGDSGWTAEAFASPLTSSATLDSFIDSTVYAYVKDATSVSSALTSFVDVTLAGDTAANGDWLFANNPTIAAYDSGSGANNPSTFSGSGDLVIDGKTATGTGGQSDASAGTDGLVHLIDIDGTNYTSITITNMDLSNSRRSLIYIHDADGITITTRNNKYGTSNRAGQAVNQFKKALVYYTCQNCTIRSYGEWFDGPDGVLHMEDCDGSDLDMRYPFISGVVSNGSNDGAIWKEINNLFTGRGGDITGKIQDVIYYAPGDGWDVTKLEDAFNLYITTGTVSVPFSIDRIRLWAGGTGGTSTAFQIGDGNYNGYNLIDDVTVIDWNGMFHFSTGHHHSVTNAKGYASELNPARVSGYAVQVQRQQSDPGRLHDCTMENNTALWFYDKEDGSPLITSLQVYYPSYGRDSAGVQGWPNHGVCVGTCDISDNVAPTGFSNNDWEYTAWTNGQGKSELWRESWKTFHYAGADGLTPSITYASPWIGDGGSQNFSAQSITSSAFGDGAAIDDVQTHDVLSLGVGGVTPYTIASVSAITNCSVSNNVTGVIFTAGGSGGAFTYQYTLQDDTGAQATGTVSGTVASASSTRNYYDHDGGDYVCITFTPGTLPQTQVGSEDPNYEYFPRNGFTYAEAGGSSSPNNSYMQCSPTSSIADVDDINDIETLSAEMVFHTNLRESGITYNLYISGTSLGTTSDETWAGFDNVAHTEHFQLVTCSTCFNAADWTWDDGDRGGGVASITTTSANQKVAIHIWTKDGGFMLGKILLVKNGSTEDSPTGAGPAESPIVEY